MKDSYNSSRNFRKFYAYYDKAYDQNSEDKIYALEELYSKYGLDEDAGDMYDCFTLLPEEGQLEAIRILTPDLEPGDAGYSEKIYNEAKLRFNGNNYYAAPYEAGIVDFYEALKAEGINLGF